MLNGICAGQRPDGPNHRIRGVRD